MATKLDDLASQAMLLTPSQRAELADRLVASLDTEALGEVDRLWIDEARRRRDEIRTGAVKAVDGEAALRGVRSRRQ